MPLKETNWDDAIFTKYYIEKIYKNTTFIPKMKITELTKGHHLQFKKYINHITSYIPYLSELKRYLFKIKPSLMEGAKDRLNKHGYNKKISTFVSIHVRLTDYHTVLEEENLPGISKMYFTRAMKYFSQKYRVRQTIIIDKCFVDVFIRFKYWFLQPNKIPFIFILERDILCSNR